MLPVLQYMADSYIGKIKGKLFKLLRKSRVVSCIGFVWAPNTSSSQNEPCHLGEKPMGSNPIQRTHQHDKREIF
jgi:hypothetical protein